jgi:hypothetical protein
MIVLAVAQMPIVALVAVEAYSTQKHVQQQIALISVGMPRAQVETILNEKARDKYYLCGISYIIYEYKHVSIAYDDSDCVQIVVAR